MRLTGSFQTIVTQGMSGTALSTVSGRSTSAGATLTDNSPPCPPVSQSRRTARAGHIGLSAQVTVTSRRRGPGRLRAAGADRPAAGGYLAVHQRYPARRPSGQGRRSFGRRHPPGALPGTGRLLDALEQFRFGPAEIGFLRDTGVADDATLRYLESYRFSGEIWGYAEGDCYFPGSPILVVESTFAEACVLETLALSVLNHDCAIASAASRMVTAADGRPLIEMGSRRTHELAAVASARAAYIAGFATTSNLRAGQAYGVPTSGTSAHAFTLVHDSERQAFTAQVEALGGGTTLLVDTYDVAEAVRAAVAVAGPGLGAVRIDSGDLPVVARQVRSLLDSLGAGHTRIVLTGDLDEYSIAALAATPVDGYGVGTSLVTGSGVPTAALVYKLVARADGAAGLRPVAKRSVGKPGRGGRKWAARGRDGGIAIAERISDRPPRPADGRALLRQLVRGG